MGLGLGLGELAVPAAALGADEVDQVLLVLGVVDLRDHAQVGLAARGERADEELVVRAEADARLRQPLGVDGGDGAAEGAVLLQEVGFRVRVGG